MVDLAKKIKLARVLEKKGADGYTPVLLQVAKQIETLENSLKSVPDNSKELKSIQDQLETLRALESKIEAIQENFSGKVEELRGEIPTIPEFPTIDELLDELEPILRRKIQPVGGHANRDIKVESATVLAPYTDIDFQGGSASILSTTDTVNKRTVITIPGAGQANYRQTATNTSIVGGDYTVEATAAVQVLLPTAVGDNGKIFDVKSTVASSVLVATNGAETIDGESEMILLENDSITIQSNNSNWKII